MQTPSSTLSFGPNRGIHLVTAHNVTPTPPLPELAAGKEASGLDERLAVGLSRTEGVQGTPKSQSRKSVDTVTAPRSRRGNMRR
ncbi:hypothetical protein CKAH01_03173 [Colletotrichum kahawae]|uniref:Uncharacterized protein n=1 Tax=Colletotrichum kahawae TaxID=34407 RepID=A0AAD9YTP7_COLKA|nr:hypothetical protein CKAH01_03173 [Colletotrichum kahawae]